MKRVILNIQDNIYDPVINMLELLGRDKVEIVSSEKISGMDKQSLISSINKILDQKDFKYFKNINNPVKWQKEQRDEWK